VTGATTQPSKIVIRPATPEDAGAYLLLVEQLAIFEKQPPPDEEAKTRLIDHLFGPKPFYKLLLAVDQGRPVAYAAYFFAYSTFEAKPTLFLEDLFVMPEYRSLKVGHRLMVTVARLAKANRCGRVDFLVLDWNKMALEFYQRHDVKPRKEWLLHRMDAADIDRVASMNDAP
jgi:GNAT superfamily N-acetyltransferase